MYTHLVAVGLGVEEQDVELREEINERKREKRNIKKLPGIGIYKLYRRWERIAFANVSLHLIVVQDRKVIFLSTEVLLTVVRQEIWHFII